MTIVDVDPFQVKASPSTTWGQEADRWNPWQTLVEKYPHVKLITDYELPDGIWGYAYGNRIWICKKLAPIKRECTLAHELTHFELNSFVPPKAPGHLEAERVVEEICARRLIPLRALAEVMLHRPDAVMRIWAYLLRVDLGTLTVRLLTLTPVERAALGEVRGGPLPTMPHYEPYDGDRQE